MRKKLCLAAICLFLCAVAGFFAFGGALRDGLSPKVDVTIPNAYRFESGAFVASALPAACFRFDEGGAAYAFIAEESERHGERAHYARRISLTPGESDGEYTELKKSPVQNALYICAADRAISDGDRVVVSRIIS